VSGLFQYVVLPIVSCRQRSSSPTGKPAIDAIEALKAVRMDAAEVAAHIDAKVKDKLLGACPQARHEQRARGGPNWSRRGATLTSAKMILFWPVKPMSAFDRFC
jgi:hypothetical protein